MLSLRIVGRHFGISQTMLFVWASSEVARCIFSELSEVLHCSVFSNWQLVQVLVEACHLVSSQAAHRHPRTVPVSDKMLCPFQMVPSGRSRDRVPGTIASFSWFWHQGLLIELQVDGVSRECEGFITVVFTVTQCGIDTAMVTKLEEGSATLSKRFIRAKHRHNIVISR